ncbi:MAG: HNH endonuclease, partial [Alteromonadales bacterium]|nr:HNH endonuclease [Alteromonadales bacterium]
DLTMQHVIPYSRGGETSPSNLVTLCEPCNQQYADRVDFGLFDAAGLHYNYDKSLINQEWFSVVQKTKAIELSKNLMQTKCEVW